MATETEVKKEIAHALIRAMIPYVKYVSNDPFQMAREATVVQSENARDALRLLLEEGFFGDTLSGLYNHVLMAINEYEG